MKVIKNVKLNGQLTDIGIEGGIIAAIGKLDAEGVDFDFTFTDNSTFTLGCE